MLIALLSLLGMILAVISAFTGLYYYFDESNTYHRGSGFLIAYIIPVVCPIMQYTVIRQYRKVFSKLIYISLNLYIFVPIACGILQIFTYGISIVNMSMVAVSVALYIFTYLDINNTVPKDMYNDEIKGKFDYDYKLTDTFMGFHCGNTASDKLAFCEMKNQKIMARSLPVEVTNGTLEGDLIPGEATIFRLQSTSDGKLRAYVAEGEILPVRTRSFGSIGIFAIPEMGRFYRHVLVQKNYPHHAAITFHHNGKALYDVFKYLGVKFDEIDYNHPAGVRYRSENPFA